MMVSSLQSNSNVKNKANKSCSYTAMAHENLLGRRSAGGASMRWLCHQP
jgi:hypothetical protein